jgi:hypothetical protein
MSALWILVDLRGFEGEWPTDPPRTVADTCLFCIPWEEARAICASPHETVQWHIGASTGQFLLPAWATELQIQRDNEAHHFTDDLIYGVGADIDVTWLRTKATEGRWERREHYRPRR